MLSVHFDHSSVVFSIQPTASIWLSRQSTPTEVNIKTFLVDRPKRFCITGARKSRAPNGSRLVLSNGLSACARHWTPCSCCNFLCMTDRHTSFTKSPRCAWHIAITAADESDSGQYFFEDESTRLHKRKTRQHPRSKSNSLICINWDIAGSQLQTASDVQIWWTKESRWRVWRRTEDCTL